MRARALAAILCGIVAVANASGCGIWDELDQSTPAPKAEAEKAADAEASPESRSEKWWKGATSINPDEGSSDLVQCRVGSKTMFMREADCQSRGGTAVD